MILILVKRRTALLVRGEVDMRYRSSSDSL
jgi:hypothetical protein